MPYRGMRREDVLPASGELLMLFESAVRFLHGRGTNL
jgi:hypothetical protein